jgi:hypothetical protein
MHLLRGRSQKIRQGQQHREEQGFRDGRVHLQHPPLDQRRLSQRVGRQCLRLHLRRQGNRIPARPRAQQDIRQEYSRLQGELLELCEQAGRGVRRQHHSSRVGLEPPLQRKGDHLQNRGHPVALLIDFLSIYHQISISPKQL